MDRPKKDLLPLSIKLVYSHPVETTVSTIKMKDEFLLDVSGIIDIETFHEYVSKKLNFPGYYGFNLNAFWDCITDEDQSEMPKILIVEGLAALKKYLPDLHEGFVECLKDYEKEYPDRKVIYRQDSPSGEGMEFDNE